MRSRVLKCLHPSEASINAYMIIFIYQLSLRCLDKLICVMHEVRYVTQKMILVIPDALNDAFRDMVGKALGIQKGNLSKAATEAFRLWLKVAPARSERDQDIIETLKYFCSTLSG